MESAVPPFCPSQSVKFTVAGAAMKLGSNRWLSSKHSVLGLDQMNSRSDYYNLGLCNIRYSTVWLEDPLTSFSVLYFSMYMFIMNNLIIQRPRQSNLD